MEGYSGHFSGPCHYSVTWKTPRSHHWAQTRNSNFFQARYSVCQEHKPLIYVQHAGEVTPYLANPTACLKEEGGQNSGLGTGMRGGGTAPSSASHVVMQGFQSHSIPLNLREDRVHEHCQHPSHVPGQPCCLFLAPLFGKSLGCQLFPCYSPSALCQPGQAILVAKTHLDTQTSGQWAKPPLRNRVYPCKTQVHSPIECSHPASTGEKPPMRIPPQKRGARVPAGAAQYLHFVVECPSYVSGVVSG